MAYKVLGWAVWKGAKFFLRRKYGGKAMRVPAVAGGLLLVAGAGVALAARRNNGG
jgi:hypothetical protein